MGAEIDRLEVQVEAQATKANNQLDKLVGKLNSLSNSLSHINSSGLAGLSNGVAKFAQASSQLSNVKTADFTRLTKNIQSLSSLNTQQIYGAASAMRTLSTAINSLGGVSASSMQVAQVAKDISKLGGVNVQRAITNLPLLATAMNNLMATLSNAPSVNRNIIDMTNALANLASQGNRVGSSSNSIVNGLNRTSSAMARTRKSSISLAAAFGKFYASWWLVIRGASKLWDSIENSMNYVETLNYFDAAFGQVANSAVSQWENAGYDSADAYYESFSSRAKELTSKMTGFNVNDDGTLTATGNASLGINPTKLMNYQATFAQMSSSIGVASETSLLLSQALTEIGADLASVKNMDFDKVWKDMASGLAGMSRTLDKYGVNIRNVNLQQKLFDLGINENITNLNQNDKALLRAIILLDSTRYAWGDLADTLNQPANQMRLLDSNLNNLSRTIGNLFLPAVSKLLPYVNGLVIGLQRLFAWVGNIFGIDLSGITSAVGDSAVDIGDLLDNADGASDALGSAAENAKKLKTATMGIDELNINSPQYNSASGSSGGISSGLLGEAFEKSFAEYQKVWDDAFSNMENRANEFAGKVEKFLQPVKDIIQDFAIGDFFKAGQDTSNLVAGIFNFFADAIDNVDWNRIGNNIGDYLAGINWNKVLLSTGNLIYKAINASLELWCSSFDAAPIETSIITGIALLNWTNIGRKISSKIGESLKAKITSIGSIIGTSLLALVPKVSPYFTKFFSLLSPGMIGELGIWIEKKLEGTFLDTKTWTGLPKKIMDSFWSFLDSIEEYNFKQFDFSIEKFFNFSETNFWWNKAKEWFSKISEDFANQDWLEIGKDIVLGIGDGIAAGLMCLVEPFYDLFNFTWDFICEIFGIHSPSKEMMPIGEYILLGIVEGFLSKISEFNEAIKMWFDESVQPWFTKEKWLNISKGIKLGISDKWNEFTKWWSETGFAKWWSEIEEKFSKENWIWDGIKEGLSSSWNAAIDSIKEIWNGFATWLNDKLTLDISPINISGKEIFGGVTLNLGKIPTFKLGGFPEDGVFMANHNELVGQFSNGRTAVANNGQIVEGISYGVKSAVEEVLAPYLQQIAQNTRETADKDASVYIGDREIARANNRGQKAMGLRIRTT